MMRFEHKAIVAAIAMIAVDMSGGAVAQSIELDAVHSDCLIEPRSTVDLGSAEEGIISEIVVQRGDFVAEGDIVARLEFELAILAVEAARLRSERRAEILSNRARLEFRQRELARVQELHQRNVVSTKSLDEAVIERRIAELGVRAAEMDQREAEANLRRAQESLDRHSIRSPVTGVIVEVPMSPGEFAYEQSPIMRIAEIDPLNVEAFLPISWYPSVVEGMSAEVTPESPVGGHYQAQVTVVDRVFDSASGTFGVRLELPNPDYYLPAGLRCTIRFMTEGRRADSADWSTMDFEIGQTAIDPDDAVRPAVSIEPADPVFLSAARDEDSNGENATASPEPASDNLIILIQEQLVEAGFEFGPLDGVLGPRTEAAIASYQDQNGLTPDGRPSRTLFDHLRQRLPGDATDAAVATAAADADDAAAPFTSGYEYFRRAAMAADRGDGRVAAFLYTNAIDAGDLTPLYQSYAYNNRGSLERARGDYGTAIRDYDSAILLKPDYVAAFLNRATLNAGMGHYELAIEDYDRAILLAPDMTQAFHGRGVAWTEQGDIERAINDYDAAIALSPDLAEVYFDRGRAYFSLGKPDLAITDFARLFERDPSHAGLRAEMERLGLLQCDITSLDDCLPDSVTVRDNETP